MPTSSQTERVPRTSHLEWVPVAKMRVSPLAQRGLRRPFVDRLANEFDPDRIGYPVLSLRDDWYYIVDGQHRIAALHQMGWGDQNVQCEVFKGLDEAGEADLFLWRNQRLNVKSFDLFQVALTAGRDVETDIARTVQAQGFKISESQAPGSIKAISALRKVYSRGGPIVLGRALRLIGDSYGDTELTAPLIEGFGLLCHRYNGVLKEDVAASRLGSLRGGANGLMNRAYSIRKASGRPVSHCVAAAAVEVVNQGRGGTKLPSWWQ